MKQVARELLAQLDPVEAVASSFLDYHAPGLDYLCLHRTDSLTVKLYMSDPARLVTCGEHDYLVQPHDHNYNFETYVIAGSVRHYTFAPDLVPEPAGTHFRFSYTWRDRKFDLAASWARYLMRGIYDVHSPGSSYFLTHDVVHTIAVDPELPTCLLLFQFVDRPEKPWTSLYTRSLNVPRTEHLYRVPTPREAIGLLERAEGFLS